MLEIFLRDIKSFAVFDPSSFAEEEQTQCTASSSLHKVNAIRYTKYTRMQKAADWLSFLPSVMCLLHRMFLPMCKCRVQVQSASAECRRCP
jgi:hypothetical protein